VTLSDTSQKAIDDYLAALRRQLRDLMEEDMNDIVEEIRAHILDKTTGSADPAPVDQTLAALGAPGDLAARYCTEEMMQRAEAHRSGTQKARIAGRWTVGILAGLVVVIVSAVGYFVGGVLVTAGVVKVMWPRGTGLWETMNSDGTVLSFGLSGGSGNTPPSNTAHDVLGWWLLPIGFILGPAIIYGTYWLGKWTARRLWPTRRKLNYAAAEPQTEI
jgi:hypothetical protein